MIESRPFSTTTSDDLGLDVPPGGDHYRAFVGPPEDYDLVSAMTFSLLVVLGLRQHDRLLDIGCGSLRVGRLLIPYLNRGGYTGLEPHEWLVRKGISQEVGESLIEIKAPRFVFQDAADSLVEASTPFDFIVAQSILSHCGADLFEAWLGQASQLLAKGGLFAATYVRAQVDTDESGWIYPHCVGFTQATVDRMAQRAGLRHTPLSWHHPRQVWSLFSHPDTDVSAFENADLSWNRSFEHYNAKRQVTSAA